MRAEGLGNPSALTQVSREPTGSPAAPVERFQLQPLSDWQRVT